MPTRCPICGISIENAKRHLRRYHRISVPSEDFARSILALYRISRKSGEIIPLVPLEEWRYEDFLKAMNILGKASLPLRRKIVIFEPLSKFFAERFPAKIIEDFPRLVKEKERAIRALAFITLTFVPSEDAVRSIIELCDRRKSAFLEYIVDLFQRFKDSLKAHIKEAIDSDKIPSPSCVFKGVFIAYPNILVELIEYLNQKAPPERIEFIIEELSELFDYMAAFPKRYFALRPAKNALLISAKAKFFGNLEVQIPEERLDRMVRQYILLTKIDDLWSRLYYHCQRLRRSNIYEQIKGIATTETPFESLLLKIGEILSNYPETHLAIGDVSTNEYLEALNDLEGDYLRGFFLYIMADINLKTGHLERALSLMEKFEEIVKRSYDYVPQALLVKAIVQEFLGLHEDALKTYRRLDEMKASWETLLLNKARLYTILGKYNEVKSILSEIPTNTTYKLILEALVAEKTGDLSSLASQKEKLSKYVFTSDLQRAFKLLVATEFMCYCLYQKALGVIWADKELRRIFLDIAILACPRHIKMILQEASKKFPDDKLLNHYLGVIAIEEERYEDALKFFENTEGVDKKPLLVNKLLAAIMVGADDIAERVYLDLKNITDADEVIELAIIHYLMYKKNFPDAYNELSKIRDLLDYEYYLALKRDIMRKRFTIDKYIYYIASRDIEETVCPLLSVPVD
ncbi:MAG: hypothetical protein QXH55_06185 [Candidatus Korarchaeota archaeon]